MCGGTRREATDRTSGRGLSPRVRGNQSRVRLPIDRAGSIPACAGEPGQCGLPPGQIAVYPRVCGGTSFSASRWMIFTGLSPRVRGNLSLSDWGDAGGRSIPACAGEPPPRRGAAFARWVYPRVCGGTGKPLSENQATYGLSPRVRGNRHSRHVRPGSRRSIPACAGEPTSLILCNDQGKVYPRVCGGTPLRSRYQTPTWGLSPRVRGNLDVRLEASLY